MKYIKLNLSFGDKLKLLFFGLISEDKLPVKEVVREIITEKPTQRVAGNCKEVINSTEEKFHVPFFELQDDDVKSNF